VNKTVVNNYNDTTINRTSYNGGPNGTFARPTESQLAVEKLHHVAPTEIQRQHAQVAAQDRRLLATVNDGKPPVLVAPRPLTPETKPAEFVPITPDDKAAADRLVVHPATRPNPAVRPDVVKPDAVKPDVMHPDVTHPDVVHPDVTRPDVVRPETVRPVQPPIERPQVQPPVMRPQVVRPQVVQPPVVHPPTVHPQVMHPQVVHPPVVHPPAVHPAPKPHPVPKPDHPDHPDHG
jgi:hypothetical protein